MIELDSQAFSTVLKAAPFPATFDDAVEKTIQGILAASSLGDTSYVQIAVEDGVVTLTGTVSDGLRLARFKNQVTAALPTATIVDQLDWVVPDCGIGIV